MLHDACNSADTTVTRLSPFGGVTKAHCGLWLRGYRPWSGPNSFTAALTRCLLDLYSTNAPFSVSDLFGKVVARLRNNGSRDHTSTPLHCTLTTEQSSRRIMLHPLSVSPQPAVSVVNRENQIVLSLPLRAENKGDAQEWKEWILNALSGAISVNMEHPDIRRRRFPLDEGYVS
jgi:hypothetical protein